MNRIRSLLTLGLALSASSLALAVDKAELQQKYNAYHAAGKDVVRMALTKSLPPADVSAKVDVMVASAVWMAREYAKAFPKGARLLGMVCDAVPAMKALAFKDLEHAWHDLEHFRIPANDPGLDLSAEENEHFTDPIHSIVHPLLVLKAAEGYARKANDDDLRSVKEEMEEGLEQVEKMLAALSRG